MKKNNLPELNTSKKEKKGGIFGFLRGTTANTTGGITPGVIGGTAQTSTGLVSLFTGKLLSTLITVAVIGSAGAVYMVRNASTHGDSQNSEYLASAQEAENYVPAIQRSEAENQGKSSLNMFTEKNKGSISFDVDNTKTSKKANDTDTSASDAAYDMASAANPEDMMNEAMGAVGEEAGGLSSSNLSTSLGGDSSSKSLMANNSPRLKQSAGFSKVGTGFKSMPKFKNNQGSLSAMGKSHKASRISSERAGVRGGKRAYAQAKAMGNLMRQSTNARNYEASRTMQDTAWEGTTAGDGETAETIAAGGLGEGAGMTVNPIGGDGSAGGYTSRTPGQSGLDAGNAMNVTPWQKTMDTITTLFTVAMVVIGIAGLMADIKPWGYIAYAILAGIAAGLCAWAFAEAVTLKSTYNQAELGNMWMTVTGVSTLACIAAAACGAAAASAASAALQTAIRVMALAIPLGMGVLQTVGSMNAEPDAEATQKYCEEHPDACQDSAALPYELSDSPIIKNIEC